MGWKSLKEHFKIKHIVHVTADGVLIGSGYVSDIVTITPETGTVSVSRTFPSFLKESYPALLAAKPEEIRSLLSAADSFAADVTVFTYAGGKIIETLCEAPGWPNVTHDGCLMYDNRFSTSKEQVVRWARSNAKSGIALYQQAIDDTKRRLAEQEASLAECEAELAELDAAYPNDGE